MKKVIQRIGILLTSLCLIFFLFGNLKLPRAEAQEMPAKIISDVPTVRTIIDPIADWINERVFDALIFVGEKLAEQSPFNLPPIVPFILVPEDVGHVIPDSNNPLYGTYSTTMKFTNGITGKTVEIINPRMYRDSLQSEWQLTPDLKGLVEQSFS